MRALILNSGLGRRMGALTSDHPKCMTELGSGETILSRQLKQLCAAGIQNVVMTTGYFDDALRDYVFSLCLPIDYTFVYNDRYSATNYIYSIFLARKHLDDDIILIHGDVVFENDTFERLLSSEKSCVVVSSSLELPQKDFKAVVEKGNVTKIGVEYFERAVASQPLYKLLKCDWRIWLDEISLYCEKGKVNCYAEAALNEVTGQCELKPLDIANMLCKEIDTLEDLEDVRKRI